MRLQKGRLAKVARGLGLSKAAVSMWREIPDKYIVAIEGITGIPREQLRPSLYRAGEVAAVRAASVLTERAAKVTGKRSVTNNHNDL